MMDVRKSRCFSNYGPPQSENPFSRTLNILSNDIRNAKSKLFNDGVDIPHQFPSHCDVIVIGGGVVGSSIAYWLKEKAGQGLSVVVVEKDPSRCSFVCSSADGCAWSRRAWAFWPRARRGTLVLGLLRARRLEHGRGRCDECYCIRTGVCMGYLVETCLYLSVHVISPQQLTFPSNQFPCDLVSLCYREASTVLSCGGLRQQFSVPENIQMSLYGAEFLRNIDKHLSVEGCDPPDVQFNPSGYLFLASEKGAAQLEDNAKIQRELGAKVELLTSKKLKKKFPWLNTEDIALGCHGLENEGWFDPWLLLHALKRKSIATGAEYVMGEAIAFEFKRQEDILAEGVEEGTYEGLDRLLVRTDDGEVRPIKFAIAVIAAGADSGNIARMARIGVGSNLLSVPLPVERRKRFVYVFHCENGPGINSPFLCDMSGMYFRREGLGGNYIAGLSPPPQLEPSTDNLDVDYQYFNDYIWPLLAHRVPSFEAVKVKSAWAGYYDYNTFDDNGIVGPHPYYNNLYIAAGFSGHGLQQAPAVGRSIAEMIVDGGFQTINIARLGYDRLMLLEPLEESNIV
uniref:FAD-dependent oxidoreductase domain-containing protein 1 n=1 Tax=Timema bartmani TaxID=61472 RepID=A0A7R9EPZ6_9NEOP|nr:unnamed protein product [Timema bartmani]